MFNCSACPSKFQSVVFSYRSICVIIVEATNSALSWKLEEKPARQERWINFQVVSSWRGVDLSWKAARDSQLTAAPWFSCTHAQTIDTQSRAPWLSLQAHHHNIRHTCQLVGGIKRIMDYLMASVWLVSQATKLWLIRRSWLYMYVEESGKGLKGDFIGLQWRHRR